jgi:hypothetical protein
MTIVDSATSFFSSIFSLSEFKVLHFILDFSFFNFIDPESYFHLFANAQQPDMLNNKQAQ